MAPVVSVVITTFNSAPFVEECLESVMAQTQRDLEIVVVDDASSDDTVLRVQAFASDRPIRLIQLETNHGGPSRPRNVGIASARGRYIALLDADDHIEPACLAEAVALFELQPDLGLVFCNPVVGSVDAPDDTHPVLRDFLQFHALPRVRAAEGFAVFESDVAYPCLLASNYIRTTGLTFPRTVFDALVRWQDSMESRVRWQLAASQSS